MAEGQFPSHFLYGAARLGGHGIGVVWHRSKIGLPKWRAMLRNTRLALFPPEPYDILYATHHQGIEPLVFLRAAGLYRKPIVAWHHQPVVKSPSLLRELLGRVFYRGFTRLVFFSGKLAADSVATGKITPGQAVVGRWGADLQFYDTVAQGGKRAGFISTGKERRDMPTLVEAFNRTGLPIDIHLNPENGGIDYRRLFQSLHTRPNVRVHIRRGLIPWELSRHVDRAACVAICCQETDYTVGLTTLVEAMALSLPVICSRNTAIPVDIDGERCGVTVPYGDADGWEKAALWMEEHHAEAEEMGRNGRRLAERLYNDDACAAHIASLLKEAVSNQNGH